MIKQILIFILIIITPLLLFLGYNFNQYRITAQFENLEPIKENISVYYKGFKLGNVKRVYPSEDFKSTNVDIIIRAKNLNLPENITAKIRVRNKHEYLELIYPKEPKTKRLTKKSVIKGEKSITLSNLFEEYSDSGDLDEIKDNLNNTIISAGTTLDALAEFIFIGSEILKESKPSIINSAKNLEQTTKNLKKLSNKLNESIQKDELSNIINNLEESSINLNNFTNTTDKQTTKLINTLLKNSNCLILNINDIINGVKKTLNKRFGTMKFLFGKPIN